jgi:hypothetical protein
VDWSEEDIAAEGARISRAGELYRLKHLAQCSPSGHPAPRQCREGVGVAPGKAVVAKLDGLPPRASGIHAGQVCQPRDLDAASHHLRVPSGSVSQRPHLQLVVKPGVAPDPGDGRAAAKADRSLASQSWHRASTPQSPRRDHPMHMIVTETTQRRANTTPSSTKAPRCASRPGNHSLMARALLGRGFDPQTPLVMRRAASAADALTTTVGAAVRRTVVERDQRRICFEPWVPKRRYEVQGMDGVDSAIAQNGTAARGRGSHALR